MNSRRAFTLIELLVVLAIIGILAGLILTAVTKAKQKGQGLQCLNNVRQLIHAWHMYADDNEDKLPSNFDGVDGLGVFTNWVGGTMAKAIESTNVALITDAEQSLLFRYLGTPKVFKCPADLSARVRSVSMNNRMNPMRPKGQPVFTGGFGTNYATFRKVHEIQRPSDMFVFLDERADTINDGYFVVDMSNTGSSSGVGVPLPYYIIDYPASYHNGGSAITFADGHSEAHHWKENSTKPLPGKAVPLSYTSENDRDMKWLQEHATYRITK